VQREREFVNQVHDNFKYTLTDTTAGNWWQTYEILANAGPETAESAKDFWLTQQCSETDICRGEHAMRNAAVASTSWQQWVQLHRWK